MFPDDVQRKSFQTSYDCVFLAPVLLAPVFIAGAGWKRDTAGKASSLQVNRPEWARNSTSDRKQRAW